MNQKETLSIALNDLHQAFSSSISKVLQVSEANVSTHENHAYILTIYNRIKSIQDSFAELKFEIEKELMNK